MHEMFLVAWNIFVFNELKILQLGEKSDIPCDLALRYLYLTKKSLSSGHTADLPPDQ